MTIPSMTGVFLPPLFCRSLPHIDPSCGSIVVKAHGGKYDIGRKLMLISEVLVDIGGRRLFRRDRADYDSRPGHAVASRKDPLRILDLRDIERTDPALLDLDPRVFRKFSKIDACPIASKARSAALLSSGASESLITGLRSRAF